MVLLSGCATKSYNKPVQLDLPDMSIAGPKVAKELAKVCTDKKCPNLINWLNEISIFKEEYLIYKAELSK